MLVSECYNLKAEETNSFQSRWPTRGMDEHPEHQNPIYEAIAELSKGQDMNC